MIHEGGRVKTLDNLREIDVMSDYLVNKENIDIKKITVWS